MTAWQKEHLACKMQKCPFLETQTNISSKRGWLNKIQASAFIKIQTLKLLI